MVMSAGRKSRLTGRVGRLEIRTWCSTNRFCSAVRAARYYYHYPEIIRLTTKARRRHYAANGTRSAMAAPTMKVY
jgi:hypothetical protein